METITPLSSGRALPDLSVVEFAIMIALMRLGPQPAPALLPTLSDWFGFAISLSAIRPSVRRLEHLGYLTTLEDGTLRTRRASAEPVALSFTALIRIVGSEFGRALKKADPPLLAHIMKKSVEDEAVLAEEALRKRQGKPNLTDAQREDIRDHARKEAREARLQAAGTDVASGTVKPPKRKAKGKGHQASDDSSKE
ncbi:MAG: hypothetical protein CVT76_05655 [Alphaproteobacteria bacterium HGW-Alphaproteobacteria-15]|nr:MAG: hypothetical protein CVT76_05655 [Alphaproteobacteria bacterium HGW-Alphaproteobacteria-15]